MDGVYSHLLQAQGPFDPIKMCFLHELLCTESCCMYAILATLSRATYTPYLLCNVGVSEGEDEVLVIFRVHLHLNQTSKRLGGQQ